MIILIGKSFLNRPLSRWADFSPILSLLARVAKRPTSAQSKQPASPPLSQPSRKSLIYLPLLLFIFKLETEPELLSCALCSRGFPLKIRPFLLCFSKISWGEIFLSSSSIFSPKNRSKSLGILSESNSFSSLSPKPSFYFSKRFLSFGVRSLQSKAINRTP